jgi:hypothetical protein
MKFFIILFIALFDPSNVGAVEIWQEYKKNPNSHPFIPNNSYAGYGYGEKRFNLFSKAPVINVKKFGAKGDGKADDTYAIRAAIASAKSTAKIFFPNGAYLVSEQIVIDKSFILLSGETKEKTIISFSKSLKEILKGELVDSKSPYAWSRGLVEFRPKIEEGDWNGWSSKKVITNVRGTYELGASQLNVEAANNLKPSLYFLRWNLSKEKTILDYISGSPDGEGRNWGDDAKHWQNRKFIFWPIEIVAVEKNSIFLKQPLRMPISKAGQIELLESPLLLREVGLENLTIRTNRVKASKHLMEEGYNGVFFHRIFQGIIHNVDVENVDNGIILNAVKNITVSKVKILGNLSTHHGFFQKYSEDVLVQDFEIDTPIIHGINADLRGSGNVWRRGKMRFGTFDLHRGMQFDNIRTNIEINNTGNSGGDKDAGPMQGRRVVHWNIKILNKRLENILQPEFFPFGALVGIQGVEGFEKKLTKEKNAPQILYMNQEVEPKDLYQAQVNLRLK